MKNQLETWKKYQVEVLTEAIRAVLLNDENDPYSR